MLADLIFLVGGIILNIPLVRALRNPATRFPRKDSITTQLVLAAFCGVAITLGLYMAALSYLVTSGLWGVLAVKRAI